MGALEIIASRGKEEKSKNKNKEQKGRHVGATDQFDKSKQDDDQGELLVAAVSNLVKTITRITVEATAPTAASTTDTTTATTSATATFTPPRSASSSSSVDVMSSREAGVILKVFTDSQLLEMLPTATKTALWEKLCAGATAAGAGMGGITGSQIGGLIVDARGKQSQNQAVDVAAVELQGDNGNSYDNGGRRERAAFEKQEEIISAEKRSTPVTGSTASRIADRGSIESSDAFVGKRSLSSSTKDGRLSASALLNRLKSSGATWGTLR
jgi:hypothetical protein